MYRVLNTFSEYKYFYISKNITSYTFVTEHLWTTVSRFY